MPLNPDVVDSVVGANFKNLGDAPAMSMAMAYQGFGQAATLAAQNAVNVQQQMNQLGVNAAALSTNNLHNLDVSEASAVNTLNAGEIAKAIAQLGSAVAGLQQMMKGAQTTLPETGQG